MLETGDYVVPRQNGSITLNKPPLYYWLMAGTMALSGDHAELGARLPSALAAVAALAVVWRMGTLLGGGASGTFALLFLLGNLLYFGHARTAEMDMLLLAVEAGATLAFLEARAGRPRWVWAGWLLAAAGFLIKGPVGILVPVTVVAVYRLADRRAAGAAAGAAAGGWIRPGRGLLLFLALVLPWFLVIFHRLPDAVEIFRRETLTRYGGELDHQEPFWFYLPVLLGGFLPGSLTFPLWLREARRRGGPAASHLGRLALTLALLLVFFSLSGSKRVYYVLPLWPLLAVGCGIAMEQARRTAPTRWLTAPTAALAAVMGLVAAAAALAPEWGGPRFYAQDPIAYGLLAVMGGLGWWGAVRAARGAWVRGFTLLTASLVVANLFLVESVGPVSNAYRSRKDFARAVAERVPEGEPLYMFRQSSFALPFYARRVMPDLLDAEELAAVLRDLDPVPVILNDGHVRHLRERGFWVEPLFERTWSPPGRPEDARYLALARVGQKPAQTGSGNPTAPPTP